ncbi:predicted protein [Plenodomus lingam JN3]|uniref:Predicted protein n=1 Tax=Leptosphaeria maculans (strain JN3 / isolate v23.1.3 / race Av1-4-5-6-7-8) TaxID=985895 RepID=E4ZJS7_LEPMJ|nr:predicted protein [Plenodomus lingam JN3]CBX91362.1 predicted protein [Plenodomus lingam JN3]
MRSALLSKPCASSSDLPQVPILELILTFFPQFRGFERGYVRGSFARGTADFQSDIYLLCEVLPQSFASFISQAHSCIKSQHSAVADTLLDTIANDFGGISFIYMLEVDGNFFQLDLYVTYQGRPWSEKVAFLYRPHEEIVDQQLKQMRDVKPSVGDMSLELKSWM